MARTRHTKPSSTQAETPASSTWPLMVSVAALLLMTVAMWLGGSYLTGGTFVYALDDAYIHMSLAKNLAAHGVFGATPFEFTPASSSPLWTLLLATVFVVTGPQVHVAFVAALISAIALLYVADEALCDSGVSSRPRAVALVWLVFATPLAPILFGGMEHPLQIAIDVALLTAAARALSRHDEGWSRTVVASVALAFLAGAVRYEGVLLVVVIALLFATRRRWRAAFAVALAGVAPAILHGVVSISNGGYFFPNPVMIKGAESGISLLVSDPAGYARYVATTVWPTIYPLFFLVAALAVLLVVQRRRETSWWSAAMIVPSVTLVVTLAHVVLGEVGWYYRYEAYLFVLVGLSLVIQLTSLAVPWKGIMRAGLPFVVAVALAGGGAAAALWRGWGAMMSVPYAMKTVYDQQYQMAHFLKANPEIRSVAIGDLGAIAFYNDDLRILDLEGLAQSREPLDRLGRHNLDAGEIEQLATKDAAQVAIVFPDYFDLPDDWVEVARWKLAVNVTAYKETVAFYAIDPADAEALRTRIAAYSAALPPSVTASIEPASGEVQGTE